MMGAEGSLPRETIAAAWELSENELNLDLNHCQVDKYAMDRFNAAQRVEKTTCGDGSLWLRLPRYRKTHWMMYRLKTEGS
jgi:hypothetical protein